MANIQSATAEIRRGKKEEERKKKQDKNIMSASATQGGHKEVINRSKNISSNNILPLIRRVLKM